MAYGFAGSKSKVYKCRAVATTGEWDNFSIVIRDRFNFDYVKQFMHDISIISDFFTSDIGYNFAVCFPRDSSNFLNRSFHNITLWGSNWQRRNPYGGPIICNKGFEMQGFMIFNFYSTYLESILRTYCPMSTSLLPSRAL